MTTKRTIRIANRCDPLRVEPRAVESWLRRLEAFPGTPVPEGELSVAFLPESEMADLHGAHLGDPTPTDVITFPGDPGFAEAGEICVGAERARRVHARHGTTLAGEILLYLAHGWLHLAGFDDRSAEDRSAMRQAERDLLALAAARGKEPSFEWRD